jgi:hypothetical protein
MERDEFVVETEFVCSPLFKWNSHFWCVQWLAEKLFEEWRGGWHCRLWN